MLIPDLLLTPYGAWLYCTVLFCFFSVLYTVCECVFWCVSLCAFLLSEKWVKRGLVMLLWFGLLKSVAIWLKSEYRDSPSEIPACLYGVSSCGVVFLCCDCVAKNVK